MRVLVLGAGVVGVTTAWYLQQFGHEVTVVDRRQGAGLETTFANGAQISVGQAEPWANPSALVNLIKWIGREDAPLLFRWRADAAQWRWSLQFLRECTPARALANTTRLVKLGTYSLAALQGLRAETGIEYRQSKRGILIFFTSERAFRAAMEPGRRMRELGVERQLKTPAECIAFEPGLEAIRERLVGGVYTPGDETGDAHRFTTALADLTAARGARLLFNTQIRSVSCAGAAVSGIVTESSDGRSQVLTADAYVVALGSYSPQLLRPLGIAIPVYPVKGYSVTLPLRAGSAALTSVSSLTDDDRKMVFSRIGDRLRAAGTAELDGYNTAINTVRCEALLQRAETLFPGMLDRSRAQFWAGLRPATPGNVPLIGPTRISNLYLNTGHGSLGWTLACGSARALANHISGRKPEVDFPLLDPKA